MAAYSENTKKGLRTRKSVSTDILLSVLSRIAMVYPMESDSIPPSIILCPEKTLKMTFATGKNVSLQPSSAPMAQ
jgi:hypothetical protein